MDRREVYQLAGRKRRGRAQRAGEMIAGGVPEVSRCPSPAGAAWFERSWSRVAGEHKFSEDDTK